MTSLHKAIAADQKEKFDYYTSLDLQHKVYQEKALSYIKRYSSSGAKVLEIGCADGSFSAFVRDTVGVEVVGVDVVASTVAAARKRGIDARFVEPESRLPFRAKSFDGVIALEIIEHVYDTDFFLEEVARVLREGGWLILSTPNLTSFYNRLRVMLGLYPHYMEYSLAGAGHLRMYTKATLRRQLTEQGFSVEIVSSPNILCPWITRPWFPGILRKSAMRLGDFFPSIGSHLILVARKR